MSGNRCHVGGRSMQSDIVDFVQNVLERNRIRVKIFSIEECYSPFPFDLGLRKQLFGGDVDWEVFREEVRKLPHRTLVHVTDMFGCYYSLLRIPQGTECFFFVGPSLQDESWQVHFEKVCSKLDLPETLCSQLKDYYQRLPNLATIGGYHTLISELGKYLFGEDMAVREVSLDSNLSWETRSRTRMKELQLNTDFSTQAVRERTDLENQLRKAVYNGDEARAFEIIQCFGGITVPFRGALTPVAFQYRLVGLNAVLRKEVERATVPLVYVNIASNRILNEIENVMTMSQSTSLVLDMIRAYCDLVRRYTLKKHSALIREIIIYANSNLHADLSLNFLSEHFNISKNYLCTLFKKELGVTLTEYITSLRVQYAAELLCNTSLSNPEIAALVGFNDVSYFARKFKQVMNQTPAGYRRVSKAKF